VRGARRALRHLAVVWMAACGPAPEPCNGVAATCERPLPDVVFAGSHNAMSNAAEGWLLPNQDDPPAAQLERGVRAMLIDTHLWQGEAYLCHTVCEAGATRLVDFLADVDAFLDAHPREVLIFVVQDGLAPGPTRDALEASGVWPRLYLPDGGVWPTLAELIDSDQRVLWTVESGAPEAPDWYTSFYDVGFDTPYAFREPSEFSCDVLRGEAGADLFLINHWISDPFPSRTGAEEVNTADALRARVADCEAAHGRLPTVLAVDFSAVGDVVAVAAGLNEG
jgi:hypothetical protein